MFEAVKVLKIRIWSTAPAAQYGVKPGIFWTRLLSGGSLAAVVGKETAQLTSTQMSYVDSPSPKGFAAMYPLSGYDTAQIGYIETVPGSIIEIEMAWVWDGVPVSTGITTSQGTAGDIASCSLDVGTATGSRVLLPIGWSTYFN